MFVATSLPFAEDAQDHCTMCTLSNIAVTRMAFNRVCKNSLISPIELWKLVAFRCEDILGRNLGVQEINEISSKSVQLQQNEKEWYDSQCNWENEDENCTGSVLSMDTRIVARFKINCRWGGPECGSCNYVRIPPPGAKAYGAMGSNSASAGDCAPPATITLARDISPCTQ
jgi:hypothetical protein